MELSDLKNIKPRQIKLLADNGIESIEALAMSTPGDIKDLEGMSDKAAKQLVWGARETLNMCAFTQVSDLKENYDYVTTGSQNFDTIMKGGISTGRITEVFGAFKSGKTNLSHTLCVTTQLPKKKGGLEGTVLYIDTENTFSKPKIERIAKRFGIDPKVALQGIFHARIYSSDHQLQMIKAAENAIKEHNAKLVIVDSLTAMVRAEYVGIGMLAPRQALLNKIIHELSRIAETYNIAVLVTNQVATFMKGTFAANDAIGGNIVAHGCHFRIYFKTKGFSFNAALEREATIVDAPDLAPDSATFFITEAGISDTETIIYPDGTSSEPVAEDVEIPPMEDGLAEIELPPTVAPIAAGGEDVPVDPLEIVEAKLGKVKKTKKK